MKFYFKKIQINIKLTHVHSFIFLLYFGFFYSTNIFAQSPIKPPDSNISDTSNASSPSEVSGSASPIKPPEIINPSAVMTGGAPNVIQNTPPSVGMPNAGTAGIPAGMPNAGPAGIPNPATIQNNTLGQISGASISNSISKILGDAGEVSIPVLMFNDQEITNINRAIDSLKNNQIYVPEGLEKKDEKIPEEDPEKNEENEIVENEKSYIYLGSVIYFSANDWVIWLNDQKISTSTNNEQKEIYVSGVDKDRIKVRWKMSLTKWKILSGKKDETMAPRLDFDSNIVESEFELRPNQTYILGSNSVVEGKAVIALIKKKESKEKSTAKKSDTSQVISNSIEQNNPIAKGGNILSTIKNLQQMNQQLDENKEQIR
jgi:hypothetical protein